MDKIITVDGLTASHGRTKINSSLSDETYERLINFYNVSMAYGQDMPHLNTDLVSIPVGTDLWHPSNIITAIDRLIKFGDIAPLSKFLFNFGRKPATQGLSLYDDIKIVKQYGFDWFVDATLWQIEKWRELTSGVISEESLFYPIGLGNFFGYESTDGKGVLIRAAMRQSYNAYQISNILADNKNTIVEIGGGWGSFPYHLFKFNDFDGQYISIDLPQVGVLSAFFLIHALPDKKIVLFGEQDDGDNDILLLPSGCAYDPAYFQDNIADLVFNSHSLTEMPNEVVLNYVALINKISKPGGYFLHKNHRLFFQHLTRDFVPGDLDKLIAKNCKSEKLDWELLTSEVEELQSWIEDDVTDPSIDDHIYYESLWRTQ